MKTVSPKQARSNALLSKMKLEIYEEQNGACIICKRRGLPLDLMHLLPKSIWVEYKTEKWNLALGCRECHEGYDNSAVNRKKSGLYARVAAHDKKAADRYFRMNE